MEHAKRWVTLAACDRGPLLSQSTYQGTGIKADGGGDIQEFEHVKPAVPAFILRHI